MRRLLKHSAKVLILWIVPAFCIAVWVAGMMVNMAVAINTGIARERVGLTAVVSKQRFVVLLEGRDAYLISYILCDEVYSSADTVIKAGRDPFPASNAPPDLFHWDTNHRGFALGAPTWLLPPIAALPAAFYYFPGRRKRKYRKAGLCITCGYDRRGLPDASAPCPECGTPG